MLGSTKQSKFKQEQILNCRRIFTDSMKIMMETADIDTFFSRYDVAAEAINEAGRVAGENTPCLNGITPKEALHTLRNDLPSILTPCIDRYMDKQTIRICNLVRGRVSKAQALEVIAENYEDRVPPECMEHWKWRIGKLVSKLKKLDEIEKDGNPSKNQKKLTAH